MENRGLRCGVVFFTACLVVFISFFLSAVCPAYAVDSESPMLEALERAVGKQIVKTEMQKLATQNFRAPFESVWTSLLEALVSNGHLITGCDKEKGMLTAAMDFPPLPPEAAGQFVMGRGDFYGYLVAAETKVVVEKLSPEETRVRAEPTIHAVHTEKKWNRASFSGVQLQSSGKLEKDYLEWIGSKLRQKETPAA